MPHPRRFDSPLASVTWTPWDGRFLGRIEGWTRQGRGREHVHHSSDVFIPWSCSREIRGTRAFVPRNEDRDTWRAQDVFGNPTLVSSKRIWSSTILHVALAVEIPEQPPSIRLLPWYMPAYLAKRRASSALKPVGCDPVGGTRTRVPRMRRTSRDRNRTSSSPWML